MAGGAQRAGSSIRKIGFLFNPPIAPYYTSLIAVWLCSTFSSGFVEASHVLIFIDKLEREFCCGSAP
jgi:hypothetical protein